MPRWFVGFEHRTISEREKDENPQPEIGFVGAIAVFEMLRLHYLGFMLSGIVIRRNNCLFAVVTRQIRQNNAITYWVSLRKGERAKGRKGG
jgi:hypothetical protein